MTPNLPRGSGALPPGYSGYICCKVFDGGPHALANFISASTPPRARTLPDAERANLARFVREAIEADRFPLSPRVRRLRALLAKIDPATAPAVVPLPPPSRPSLVLAKKPRR